MKVFQRVFSIILIIISAISLAATVCLTISRAIRHDWLITTAEITFIGTPDGVVYGTFTDCNGKLHPEHQMYYDGKFAGIILNYTFNDPEPFIGTTVRIMYDPSTLAMEERSHSFIKKGGETVYRYTGIEIESYDNWLKKFIVSVSVFVASAVLLAGIIIVSRVRKRAAGKLEKT